MHTLLAFIDPDFGFTLNHRRVCRDKVAIQHLCEHTAKNNTLVLRNKTAAYILTSMRSFPEIQIPDMRITEDMDTLELSNHRDDIVFVEDETPETLQKLLNQATELILYVWDNQHLHDQSFPDVTDDPNWRLIDTQQVATPNHPEMRKLTFLRRFPNQ